MPTEQASDNATRTKLLLIRKFNPPMVPPAVFAEKIGREEGGSAKHAAVRSVRRRDDSVFTDSSTMKDEWRAANDSLIGFGSSRRTDYHVGQAPACPRLERP